MGFYDKEAALMRVIDNYSNMMLRTACIMVKDYNLAEDITQEALIKFYYNLDSYRAEASIKTYLFRILINECRQAMRKSWFRHVVANDKIDGFRAIEGEMEDLVEKMDLVQSILKLEPIYREVIILHYYNDLPIREISSVLKKSEGTIKSRLKRGRDKLRAIVGEAVLLDQEQE